jgi:general secretion pathway protein M
MKFVTNRMPGRALFLAFNACALVLLGFFILAPLVTHFIRRSEDISESVARISHYQALTRDAEAVMKKAPQSGDPFLAGGEERVISADLQASLKAIASTAGVRLLGIRGLPDNQSKQLHMVTVSMELEGTSQSIRNVIMAIEDQVPFLLVTAASLRSAVAGDDGLLRAELTVQGAIRANRLSSGAAAAISQ